MPAKTIADAHREAACSLIAARWGQQLVIAAAQPMVVFDDPRIQRLSERLGQQLVIATGPKTVPHDDAETAATQRIQDLTALEDAPADVVDHVDSFFSAVRSDLINERTRLEEIVSDPVTAALLYPVISDLDPTARLVLLNRRIDTLDAVWTPGGGA